MKLQSKNTRKDNLSEVEEALKYFYEGKRDPIILCKKKKKVCMGGCFSSFK